jgi:hypothetical protein
VVEVVSHLGSRLDEPEPEPFTDVEVRLSLARLVDGEIIGKLRDRDA